MINLGQGVVVVGGQWGDEGKGRVVDVMARYADAIVRFQGGNNAGHSLKIGDLSLVLHLLPCGIVRKDKLCLIGAGVVLDPEALLKEIAELDLLGFHVGPHNLQIAKNAHVILPVHKLIDHKREEVAKNPIGTTKRGIGPCYEDKISRFGIRVMDLLCEKILIERIKNILIERHSYSESSLKEILSWSLSFGQKLKPYLSDVGEIIHELLIKGKRVMFEGAQGSLLDVDHGTYPYVTSSNCLAGEAALGSGIGPKWLSDVILVTKPYCTRVGEGPFFTEADEETQNKWRQKGGEFGATTGRPRRCGFLDLPLLKYAARLNGATSIALTKTDILTGMGKIKVGVGYDNATNFLDAMSLFGQKQKVYPKYIELEEVPSFSPSVKNLNDLPFTVRKLCDLIEDFTLVKVNFVSFGAKRGDELWLNL